MGLRVWLPLTGDLRNLGCSSYNITAINTPTYVDGKIGQCYQRTTTSNRSTNGINIDNNLLDILGNEASIAIWVKPLGTHTHYNGTLISSGNWNTSRWAFGVSQDNSQVDVLCGSFNNYITCAVPVNEWTHLTSTFNNGICKLYKNGVYVGEKTEQAAFNSDASNTTIGRETYAGGYFGFNGLINDVRIYDHCLSAAEVHEIAQGLVLHYKLDASSEEKITTIPSANVYSYPTFNTSTATGSWYHWGPSGHSGSYGQNTDKKYIYNKNNTYSHWISEDAGTGKYYLLYQSPAFEGGYRSFQAIIKEENSLPITESICYPDWNARNGGIPNDKWTTIKSLGDGFYYCCCEGVSQNGSDDLIGIIVNPGYKIYVSECYLENDTETCSPIFSYSSNVIQDSSGYNHNATLNSSLTLNADSPRYSFSSYFSPNVIATSNNLFGQGTLLSEFTWAGWVRRKYDDGKYKVIYSGPANIGLYTDYSLYIGWKSAKSDGTTTGNGAAGGSATVPLNTWTHICITYKDGIGNFYINGNKTKTFNYTSYGTFIEAYGQNYLGASNWDGDLSDVRIYCTALLDTDIKLLYNIGMKVDNLGGVHTFEFNETQTRELLSSNTMLTASYTSATVPYTGYNNGEVYLSGKSTSIGSPYIPISPSNHTYYYDFDISISANNQIYIGFERYDAEKTARSNAATAYIITRKPNEDINHAHYSGIVDLTTDGVNPTDTIRLRILNGWASADSSYELTIHSMSLREVSTIQQPQLQKNGIFALDELKEYQKAAFYKNGFVEATEFIEM